MQCGHRISLPVPRKHSCRRDGGSACVIRCEGADHVYQAASGKYCTVLHTEKVALLDIVTRCTEGLASSFKLRNKRILVFTDSKSCLEELNTGSHNQSSVLGQLIWSRITAMYHEVGIDSLTFQFVPGHVGLEGNELADSEAKEAAELTQSRAPIPLEAVKMLTRDFNRVAALHRRRHKSLHHFEATNGSVPQLGNLPLTRVAESIMAQLRTGHSPLYYKFDTASPLIKTYRKVDLPPVAEQCAACGTLNNTEHIVTMCPKFTAERDVLYKDVPDYSTYAALMSWHADKVLKFLQDAGILHEFEILRMPPDFPGKS